MPTDDLRSLLANATPPVWGARLQGRDRRTSITIDDGEIEIGQMTDTDDAALIVAAVNSLPALLAVVDAAEKWMAEDDAYTEAMSREDWQTCDQLDLQIRLDALRAAVNAVKGTDVPLT